MERPAPGQLSQQQLGFRRECIFIVPDPAIIFTFSPLDKRSAILCKTAAMQLANILVAHPLLADKVDNRHLFLYLGFDELQSFNGNMMLCMPVGQKEYFFFLFERFFDGYCQGTRCFSQARWRMGQQDFPLAAGLIHVEKQLILPSPHLVVGKEC